MDSANNTAVSRDTITVLPETFRVRRLCADVNLTIMQIAIPTLHVLIMVAGLVVNVYMLFALRRKKKQELASGTSRKQSASKHLTDGVFAALAVCDIVTLLATPLWLTQNVASVGWVYGTTWCKIMKGGITVRTKSIYFL